MPGNSILDELVFDQSSGALLFNEVRYILIRPETIVGFQKAIEENAPSAAKDAIFQGGYSGGYLSAQRYQEIHHFSETELIEFMLKMGTEIGWGHFKLDEYNAAKQVLRLTVEKSPFAEVYGESSEGVCHLIRGVFSGLASILFGRKCIASEVECLAKGNDHCIFHMATG